VDDRVWFALVQISHAPGHPEATAMSKKKTISTKCRFNMEIYILSSEKQNTWQYQGHISAPSDHAAFLSSECRLLNHPVFNNNCMN
jgi:hypothetical protein